MPYCNDCGTWVNGSDRQKGQMDDDGNCWQCSGDIDARGEQRE